MKTMTTMKTKGDAAADPSHTVVTVHLSPDLAAALDASADANGWSRERAATEMVRAGLRAVAWWEEEP